MERDLINTITDFVINSELDSITKSKVLDYLEQLEEDLPDDE